MGYLFILPACVRCSCAFSCAYREHGFFKYYDENGEFLPVSCLQYIKGELVISGLPEWENLFESQDTAKRIYMV